MKYVGSKMRMMKYLKPILQGIIDNYNIKYYIEPFVGGANVINHIQAKNKYGYDSNCYIIALYNAIKDGWQPWNEGIKESMTKEEYNNIKTNKDKYPQELVGLIGSLCSYCGKWWGGYANTNKETYKCKREYFAESLRELKKEKDMFLSSTFLCCDYKDVPIIDNSLVYCDPPYQNSTGYKNNTINYSEYWDYIRCISQNAYVVCSEYQAPDDFIEILNKSQNTPISGKHKSNTSKEANEKLFIYDNSPYVDNILKVVDKTKCK